MKGEQRRGKYTPAVILIPSRPLLAVIAVDTAQVRLGANVLLVGLQVCRSRAAHLIGHTIPGQHSSIAPAVLRQ